ncbi:DsrE family protein [Caenispirillum salinarum]|uniref:DsrE family protein n=1 Tax=Caenispirillum salinarum TaxID=859058 RepID=UPI00384F8E2C
MTIQTTDYVGTLFDEQGNPDKVTVAFTMGNKALEKGHSATVILMADAVRLGLPGRVDGMDIGAPFKPVPELLEGFLAKGGQVAVCKSCMEHNGLKPDQLDSRFPVITADDVIDLVMASKGALQIS